MRRTLLAGSIVMLIAVIAVAPSAAAGPPPVPEGRRVVVFSVPGLTWKDMEAPELGNLRALLDQSAIANVATRVTSVVSEPGEAYLTLGTGRGRWPRVRWRGCRFKPTSCSARPRRGRSGCASTAGRPTPRSCRWDGP